MRLPEHEMPCFGYFNSTNFACGCCCSYKIECIAQTPTDAIEPANVTQEPIDVDVPILPGPSAIETEPVEDATEAAPSKQDGPPKSRFDVIDIPGREGR